MTRIIDVSLGIGADMLVWPGDPAVSIDPSSRISRGDSANVSSLHMGSHTGTHVDPPFHFIDGGATAEALPLDALVGDAVVADLGAVDDTIGVADLEALNLPDGVARVLFRTSNSSLWTSTPVPFPERYVSLSVEGARWIVARGIRLVGTDFLSIEARGAPGHPVHTTLLRPGIVIVEGLALASVEPGAYTFVCLPLKILGGDGAPARAILMD